MPISDSTTPAPIRMAVSAYQTGTDAMVSFDLPLPNPAGMTISDAQIRDFYQDFINALERSPDFYQVRGTLITEHSAAVTPDA
ncbi:hypothetical protein [Nakamurella sp.]|uniref:hypothetical protein n=1 Tax=Nakamurella sp. TaxID=1869182 RepID=UPI003B3AC00F